jgi:ATP-binding cassette subfamily B multidrug efflux pump
MFHWFEQRLPPFPAVEPSQPPRNLLAFCHHYTKGAWRPILIMAALASAIAVAEVSLLGFLGNVVDWLAKYSRDTLYEKAGGKLVLIAVVIVVLLPLAALFQSLVLHQTLLGNHPMRIRWNVHRYLLRQSLAYFNNEFAGRIATKLMQTALAVRESVIKVLDVLNYVSVYFVGAMIIAASADLRLIVPLLLWLAAYLSLLRFFVPRLRDISEQQADARSVMTGRIVDSYTNIATVKLFSHSKREEAYARESMEGFLSTVYRQMRLVTQFWASLYALNALLLVSVSAVALHLWVTSAIQIGAVAMAIGLVLRLGGMSQWILWEVSALFENIGTVKDGMSSISVEQRVVDLPSAPRLDVRHGAIRFESVNFRYIDGVQVFESLDIDVAPGERVGIVGRSGAGKSTLVNLLLRFYDVDGGTILIDGQNIAEVGQESLRESIGVVTQDTSLLHRSVGDNILYGRPDATGDEMVIAARKAEAHDFIEKLADTKGRTGYAAHVGERGVTLSGGQRQRIAIARVMLKDAPILVLDEATSALDSEIEAAIQGSLHRLMSGKTVIAIAHRLSTIAALDRLIVLDEGRIVEQGSHQELLRRGGLYARLWARQSGGFLGLDDAPGTAAQ